jgi:virulence-associated protein VapD
MAQKTNLNVSPYFDDFSEKDLGAKDKNYYKILFNPGKPIQARELNTLQSILQNQVESFGSHIFKEGSVVIPGNIVYDGQFHAVKLNPQQYAVEITTYLNNLVGKKITGQISGVTAIVQTVQSPNSEVEYPTIYVKYINSNSDFEVSSFQNNEQLYADEIVGSVAAGTPLATTISSGATSIGSAASIGEGIYFIRGTFVRVERQTIILDYYTNTPSYRVGLRVDEQIITAKDDSTLYDNAKGFTNYAAPGADRFKISLALTKKPIDDFNDTDFVELLRLKNGAIKKIDVKSSYSIIRDYLAQRTYDESGDYVVNPFQFSIHNSLNDALGNDGIYFSNEKTDQGNTPTENLMSIKFSPGKAYVRGYDVEKTGVEIVDVPKPRTTQSVENINFPFEMGNLIRINNVSGAPKQKKSVELYDYRKSSNSSPSGTKIGDARIYTLNLTDSAYSGNSTNWDLYLYDIQTYTKVELNTIVSSTDLPSSSFIKGKSSGASGYATAGGSNSNIIYLSQTSGSFIVGEQILINGIDSISRSIKSIRAYSTEDIKSIYQSTAISGYASAFIADTQLDRTIPTGFFPTDTITIDNGNVTASGKVFSGISTNAIIRYQRIGFTTETYNRVDSISSDKTTITLSSVPSIDGICDGDVPISQIQSTFSLGIPKIRNQEKGFLYSELPEPNISSTNLNNSTVTFTAQSTGTLVSTGSLTVNTSNFDLGINTTTAQFETFDEERYSIHYNDGTIENLTSDKFSLSNNQVTFNNIQSKTIDTINATFVKNGIQNKLKKYNRSNTININFSKNTQSGITSNTSLNDGLIYNSYYGLRVQDEEICLKYTDVVKVIAVYESLNNSDPILDVITFSSQSNVDTNAIIGENIVGQDSKAVARIVSKPSSNTLGIVYLNNNKFTTTENVLFELSNINTKIVSFTAGKYKNITNKFILDKGQKEQYYDYSKLIRRRGESEPSNKLLIVFDHYTVPSDDNGDVFTVNSYEQERFNSDIPFIGINNVRASDTLDFRPRVVPFTGSSSSPFDFSSRSFNQEPKLILTPNESSLISYEFYLGRIDKLYLNKLGDFIVSQGTPSVIPTEPPTPNEVLQLATIKLPPYLYNPRDAAISLVDNRRYTMRDIGLIENRVKNLERVTSLSLLELNTQSLQIQDAQGFNRFKTGFFVDDFKNYDLMNNLLSTVEIDVDNNELIVPINRNSINLLPVSSQVFTNEDLDLNNNFILYDSNVQKTGDVITLKYESVGWIEQPLATKVENVNPFNVISYSGSIKLNPESDNWVRTIDLDDIFVQSCTSLKVTPKQAKEWIRENNAQPVFAKARIYRKSFWEWSSRKFKKRVKGATTTSTESEIIDTGDEIFMRSRNTGFYSSNLRPLTRFYQFLDGASQVDFVPKLIEISPNDTLQNYGSSGSFQVGETVIGTINGQNLISFRVASSNHKEGLFNSPSTVYNINPYNRDESISESYSSSSKVLNVDIESLCQNAQGLYSGYLLAGMKLVGNTSGAVAYVKDLRLISDNYGDLIGSFFLRDPYSVPPPIARINTGSKVYKLTSSQNNEEPPAGSTSISSAEEIYESKGTWEEKQTTITTITTKFKYKSKFKFIDPLAQSFVVGRNVGDVSSNVENEDVNGAFLTAVDLFFATKDSNNAPLTVQVRTLELGTPTTDVLSQVTLKPNDIVTSSDASVATKVTFDYPVYLSPGLEYAIVVLSPQSDQYELWIAEMGEKTVNTSSLPDSESVRYSKQFAIGSLFKSQNGSIWTANQYQDLKFKLYKANFTSTNGSAFFQNPSLNESNGYIPTLRNNPIKVYPRRLALKITSTTDNGIIGILTSGRKISGSGTNDSYKYGYIFATGAPVNSVDKTNAGVNYTDTTSVSTYPITGNGTGLIVDITTLNGKIDTITPTSFGNGYAVGDVVGIVTSSVSANSGKDARITITAIDGLDTLYVSNAQANDFTDNIDLVYYDNSGSRITLNTIQIETTNPIGGLYDGSIIEVSHFEHGMYAANNKLVLDNVESNVSPATLAAPISISDTSITLTSTENFALFEGIAVGAGNPGYVKIGNELIKYQAVSNNQLTTITRGFDSTIIESHTIDELVYKYEFSGISLRRINTTHDISDISKDIDTYFVEIDRSSVVGVDRSNDVTATNYPQLSFNSELSGGGSRVTATQNIQYDTIVPHISSIIPSSVTDVSAQIRTVSGTSAGGNEISFQDQGYQDVELGSENKLSSTRIVCSHINEITYLNGILLQDRSKSLITKVNLETRDTNLSPIIFWKDSSVLLLSNSLNNPISDYINDRRVNSIVDDPHSSVYVSNTIRLEQPATSLKVILSAYRSDSADFRVLYSLIRPDSSEIEQTFELFPGYNNLTIDNNQDGYLDVVDPSQNSGLPDKFIPSSLEDQFLEYEFTASNLGNFSGYTIKIVMSGTNQAYAPRFADLRSIAIR